MRRRFVVTVLILVMLGLAPSLQGLAQAPLDPQALIGEWVGKWTRTILPGHGRYGGQEGPYALTIDRVDGNHVFGTVNYQGQSRTIRANLSGNRLTFGNERFTTALNIDGDQIRGTLEGGGVPPREIALVKKK
jgi:hypothetical protein